MLPNYCLKKLLYYEVFTLLNFYNPFIKNLSKARRFLY
jgi:hypothetical protein